MYLLKSAFQGRISTKAGPPVNAVMSWAWDEKMTAPQWMKVRTSAWLFIAAQRVKLLGQRHHPEIATCRTDGAQDADELGQGAELTQAARAEIQKPQHATRMRWSGNRPMPPNSRKKWAQCAHHQYATDPSITPSMAA